MKKTKNPVFVLELLMLFVLLLMVIVTIAQTVVAARNRSLYARHLTEAVCLAQECAEVSLSARDRAEAGELLSKMDFVKEFRTEGDRFSLRMSLNEEDGTLYRIDVDRREETADRGVFAEEEIRVYLEDAQEALYTLKAADYAAGGAA